MQKFNYLQFALVSIIIFLSACEHSPKVEAKDSPLKAIVDKENHQIMFIGSIKDLQQMSQIAINDLENGEWSIIASPVNQSNQPIGVWEVLVSGDARLVQNSKMHSVQLRKVDFVKERNAVIFSEGAVRPGEVGLKVFTIDIEGPLGRGGLVFRHCHHPPNLELTADMIENGLPPHPLHIRDIEIRYVN